MEGLMLVLFRILTRSVGELFRLSRRARNRFRHRCLCRSFDAHRRSPCSVNNRRFALRLTEIRAVFLAGLSSFGRRRDCSIPRERRPVTFFGGIRTRLRRFVQHCT
uniref:Putative secreted protein n=1 Tax=Ixodes scapularis TaxID=6945 RepID=A0A4D5REF6_IXOSC